MKVELKMVIVLTAIALISGGVLGLAYTKTSPKIQRNLELAKENALKKVVANVHSYETRDVDRYTTVFIAKDEAGHVVGYGVLIQGSGFQGPIKLMVGFDTTGTKLTGLEVIENVETPGLGNRITEDWFKKQFQGRIPPIQVVKGKKPENEHEIQAITGATISSRAVVRIVNLAQTKLASVIGTAPSPEPKEQEPVDTSSVSKAPAHKKAEALAQRTDRNRVRRSEKKVQAEQPDTICLKYMSKFIQKILRCKRIPMPDSLDVFVAYGPDGREMVGSMVEGAGFMDRIKLLVVMEEPDFRVVGIDILQMAEGEAFGRGRDSTFWSQFIGHPLPVQLKCESETGDIDAISGATETSRTVVALVNMAKVRAEKALTTLKS